MKRFRDLGFFAIPRSVPKFIRGVLSEILSLRFIPAYKTSMSLDIELLSKAANQARGLAIDAVHASQSGHLGLPLGCAEMGAVLFGHALRHCPSHPEWLDRDRFVLSAGHGSMFLYGWLHLSGYREMSLEEVKRFRQLNSKTPGHPELTH